MRALIRLIPIVLAGLAIAGPSGAGATTTLGETFVPTTLCGSSIATGTTYLQTTSPSGQYQVPAAGVITSWSHLAAVVPGESPPQVKLKVARQASGDHYFAIVGESSLVNVSPMASSTFPVQIPVQAGDLLGLHIGATTPAYQERYCGRAEQAGYGHAFTQSDDPPGRTFQWVPANLPKNLQLDISATLETTPCRGQLPTIAGTAVDDALSGTSSADVIVGLEGDDSVSGLEGEDMICGGAGKDRLRGGKGNDKLLGQQGKDKLRGGRGKDLCAGGKGNDSGSKCEKEKSV